MRIFCLLAAACLVTGCTTTGGGGAFDPMSMSSPAPLANNLPARQAVVTAFNAFQVVLNTEHLLAQPGVPAGIALTPGSVRARHVADLNDRVLAALKAANAAIDAGSTAQIGAALDSANTVLVDLQQAIAGA